MNRQTLLSLQLVYTLVLAVLISIAPSVMHVSASAAGTAGAAMSPTSAKPAHAADDSAGGGTAGFFGRLTRTVTDAFGGQSRPPHWSPEGKVLLRAVDGWFRAQTHDAIRAAGFCGTVRDAKDYICIYGTKSWDSFTVGFHLVNYILKCLFFCFHLLQPNDD